MEKKVESSKLRAIKESISNSRFREAAIEAEKIFIENPNCYDALLLLALSQMKLNNSEMSEKFYKMAIDLSPSKDYAYEGLAMLYTTDLMKYKDLLFPLLLNLLRRYERKSVKYEKYFKIALEVSSEVTINENYILLLDEFCAHLNQSEIINQWKISMYRIEKLLTSNITPSNKIVFLNKWLYIYRNRLCFYDSETETLEDNSSSISSYLCRFLPEFQQQKLVDSELEVEINKTFDKMIELNVLTENSSVFAINFKIDHLVSTYVEAVLNFRTPVGMESCVSLLQNLKIGDKKTSGSQEVQIFADLINCNWDSLSQTKPKRNFMKIFTAFSLFRLHRFEECIAVIYEMEGKKNSAPLSIRLTNILPYFKNYLLISCFENLGCNEVVINEAEKMLDSPYVFFQFVYVQNGLLSSNSQLSEKSRNYLCSKSNEIPAVFIYYLNAIQKWLESSFEEGIELLLKILNDIDSFSLDLSLKVYILLSQFYRYSGDIKASLKCCLKATKCDSKAPGVYFELAKTYVVSKKLAESFLCLKHANKLGMSRFDFLQEFYRQSFANDQLGDIYQKLQEKQDLPHFTVSQKCWFLFALGFLNQKMNKPHDSISCLQQCLSLQPNDMITWKLLADSYLLGECAEAAIISYTKVLENSNTFSMTDIASVHIGIAKAYQLLKQTDDSLQWCLKGYKLFPEDIVVIYETAKAYLESAKLSYRRRMYIIAIEYIEQSLSFAMRAYVKEPEYHAVHELLSICLLECISIQHVPSQDLLFKICECLNVMLVEQNQKINLLLSAVSISQIYVNSNRSSHSLHLNARCQLALIKYYFNVRIPTSQDIKSQMDNCIKTFLEAFFMDSSKITILSDLACSFALFGCDILTIFKLLCICLKESENDAITYHNAAVIFYASDNHQSARFFLNHAINLDPNIQESWTLKALLIDKSCCTLEKLLCFMQSLTTQHNSASLYHFGRILSQICIDSTSSSGSELTVPKKIRSLVNMCVDFSNQMQPKNEFYEFVLLNLFILSLFTKDFSPVFNHFSRTHSPVYTTVKQELVELFLHSFVNSKPNTISRYIPALNSLVDSMESARNQLLYGLALFKCGFYRKSSEVFTAAFNLENITKYEKLISLQCLAILAFKTGNDAIKCSLMLKKCLEMDSDNVDSCITTAAHCILCGNLSSAETFIEELTRMSSRLSEKHQFKITYLQIMHLLTQNNATQAKSHILRFLHKYPCSIQNWELLLKFLLFYEWDNYKDIESIVSKIIGNNILTNDSMSVTYYFGLYSKSRSNTSETPKSTILNQAYRLMHAQPYSAIGYILLNALSLKLSLLGQITESSQYPSIIHQGIDTPDLSPWLSDIQLWIKSLRENKPDILYELCLLQNLKNFPQNQTQMSHQIKEWCNESAHKQFVKFLVLGNFLIYLKKLSAAEKCFKYLLKLASGVRNNSYCRLAVRQLIVILTKKSQASAQNFNSIIQLAEKIDPSHRDPVVQLSIFNSLLSLPSDHPNFSSQKSKLQMYMSSSPPQIPSFVIEKCLKSLMR